MNIQPPGSSLLPGMPRGAAESGKPNNGAPAEKDWTVLFYMDGNNDIEGDVLTCFLTTEEVSDIKNMNLVAQLARAPQSVAHEGYKDDIDGDWSGVRRYHLTPGEKNAHGRKCYTGIGEHNCRIDSPVLADLSNADMSDPATLKDFLAWGIKSFPAKHYMVVLADHGAGFMGALSDYKSRKNMPLLAIQDAMRKAREETGVKPDVLVMDDCLMGQVECAHQLRDEAGYYVATESINYSNFPFQGILKSAAEKGADLTPGEFASLVVKESADNIHDIPTMASLRPGATKAITRSVKRLADTLLATATAPETVRSIFENTQYGSPDAGGYKPYEDFRDIKHMAYLLSNDERVTDAKVKKAAANLYKLLGAGLVTEEYHDKSFYRGTPGVDSVSGLSIYLPTDNYMDSRHSYPANMEAKNIEPFYKATDFAKETGWDRVLERFFSKSA